MNLNTATIPGTGLVLWPLISRWRLDDWGSGNRDTNAITFCSSVSEATHEKQI